MGVYLSRALENNTHDYIHHNSLALPYNFTKQVSFPLNYPLPRTDRPFLVRSALYISTSWLLPLEYQLTPRFADIQTVPAVFLPP